MKTVSTQHIADQFSTNGAVVLKALKRLGVKPARTTITSTGRKYIEWPASAIDTYAQYRDEIRQRRDELLAPPPSPQTDSGQATPAPDANVLELLRRLESKIDRVADSVARLAAEWDIEAGPSMALDD